MHMSNASVQVKTKLNWVFIGLAIFLCLLANFPQMEAGDVGGPCRFAAVTFPRRLRTARQKR